MRNHARIALLHVVVGKAGGQAIIRHRREILRLHQHPVVAHALRGQLADVSQREFHLRTVGSDRQLFLVVLDGIVAGDCKLADLPCRLCRCAEQQRRHGDDEERSEHIASESHVNPLLLCQEPVTPSRFCMMGLVVVYCRNCFFSGNKWCWMPKAASAAS